MGDVATAFAIGAGITAGLYAGRGFRNRSRRVRVGITVFNAYFGLIIVVLAIAVIRLNSS